MCWLEWLRVCACSWVHSRASFDSKSFAKVDVTDGQRAPFSTMNHVRFQSCYVRHIVVAVVVVSGIQPTPIGWVIISSGAGNHCEKSRDDSVYKPMTTDGHFLLRFLSKQNKNLLLILKPNRKYGVFISIWI